MVERWTDFHRARPISPGWPSVHHPGLRRSEGAPMPIESTARAPAVDRENRRAATLFVILISLALLLGAFLRINRFLLNRSLYIDEALLALNIIERTPLQLLGQLSFDQAAPFGFTLLVKLLTMAFGISEPVLRFLPLMAGLVSLPLFYLVANRWLPRWASLLAVVLFAVSDALANYAVQLKQYSSDVALTLL